MSVACLGCKHAAPPPHLGHPFSWAVPPWAEGPLPLKESSLCGVPCLQEAGRTSKNSANAPRVTHDSLIEQVLGRAGGVEAGGQRGSAQMLAKQEAECVNKNACACMQMSVHVPIWSFVCSLCIRVGATWCIRVYQGVSGCIRVYQGASGCIRVYQGASGCIRVYQGVSGWERHGASGCIRVYQGASGWERRVKYGDGLQELWGVQNWLQVNACGMGWD